MKSTNINMGDIIKFELMESKSKKIVVKYGTVIRRLKILESVKLEENNTMSYQVSECDTYGDKCYYLTEDEILEVYKKGCFNLKKDKK